MSIKVFIFADASCLVIFFPRKLKRTSGGLVVDWLEAVVTVEETVEVTGVDVCGDVTGAVDVGIVTVHVVVTVIVDVTVVVDVLTFFAGDNISCMVG